MTGMVDIWDGEGFTIESLTAAINNEPYRPGQISALGIFEEDGVSTTRISIEMRDGKLSLVEPSARGGPGETTGDDDRSRIPFDIDHYQRDDSVLADEVQNVRAFGTTDTLETIQDRVERKGKRHAQDLTMTLEYQRIGAIKGNVTSKSGKVLHNLYNRFGIAVPAAMGLPEEASRSSLRISIGGATGERELKQFDAAIASIARQAAGRPAATSNMPGGPASRREMMMMGEA